MELERWRQVEHLYHAALEHEESERDAFLDAACCGDSALREEVGSLLSYDKRAEHFMEGAALESAVKLLAEEQIRSLPSSEANSALIGKTISHYRIVGRVRCGRHGDCVQGGRYPPGPEGGAEIPAPGPGEKSYGAGAIPAGGACRLGAQSPAHLHDL